MEERFEITFSNGLTARAIRVDPSTDLSAALQKIGLKPPHPVLVLIGGAGGMGEADSGGIRPLFAEVLAPVAEAQGAFVVDGGTDVGVMRLMGQARREKGATFPLVSVAVEAKVILPTATPSSRDASRLEPHHTHFVLVPGSDWGEESPWLANVAQELSGGAPSITVLINGGNTAREDVSQSIKVGRPVVVVAGTGRLADEIAKDPQAFPLIHVAYLAEGFEKLAAMLTSLLEGGKDESV